MFNVCSLALTAVIAATYHIGKPMINVLHAE